MIGYHTLWDVYECDITTISFKADIEKALNEMVAIVKLGKVSESYKQFDPAGVTGIILLEESHISIHTWPEHQYAAVDLFSCRPFDIQAIESYIRTYFKTTEIKTKIVERGHAARIPS